MDDVFGFKRSLIFDGGNFIQRTKEREKEKSERKDVHKVSEDRKVKGKVKDNAGKNERGKKITDVDGTYIKTKSNLKVSDIKDFFNLFYPNNKKGKIGIWDDRSKMTKFFDVRRKELIEDYVNELVKEGKNVYYNVSLQDEELAIKKRMERKVIKKELLEKTFIQFFKKEFRESGFAEIEYSREKGIAEKEGREISEEKEKRYKERILTDDIKREMIKKIVHKKEVKEYIKGIYEEKAKWKRGSTLSADSSFGIWLDVDIEVEGHHKTVDKNVFKTFIEAYDFLMSLAIKPTLIVNSGGGYHVYYVLNEVVVYENDEDRLEFEEIVKNVALTISKEAEKIKREASIDKTSDLARLLRVPFTKNLKDKNNPKEVEVIYKSDKRYTVNELKSFISDDVKSGKQKSKSKRAKVKKKKFMMLVNDERVSVDTSKVSTNVLPNAELMYKGCAFIKHCVDNPNEVSYTEWMYMMQIALNCEDGEYYAHKWSENHSEYDEFETDIMIDNLSGRKPVTHSKINFAGCEEKGCNRFHSPISFAYISNH